MGAASGGLQVLLDVICMLLICPVECVAVLVLVVAEWTTRLTGSLEVALPLVLMQCHVLVWHGCAGVCGLGLGLGLFGSVRLGLVQL